MNEAQQVTARATANGHGSPHQDLAPRTRRRLDNLTNPLVLTGGAPQTVFVTLHPNNTVTFALKGGPSYSEIAWLTNGYALVITFVFSSNIEELVPTTPAMWFSDTVTSTDTSVPTTQMCCVPSVPGTFSFTVQPKPSSGLFRVDPKVVVTPIVTP